MSDLLNTQQLELLGQVHTSLQRSSIAYKEYLANGKTFAYARILRYYNDRIRQLLLDRSYLLGKELQADALLLVAHYDVWMQKWDDLKAAINPDDDVPFIFQNTVTFPRQAATNLENEFMRLKLLLQ